jgi:hypothetical protein
MSHGDEIVLPADTADVKSTRSEKKRAMQESTAGQLPPRTQGQKFVPRFLRGKTRRRNTPLRYKSKKPSTNISVHP